MNQMIKCPKCGANLKVEAGMHDYMFCSVCGEKIDLNALTAGEYTGDKQLELEKERIKAQKEIELKKLEVEVIKKRKEAREQKMAMSYLIGLPIVLGIIYFIVKIFGLE